ncbi:MAG: hypothetical protein KBI35_03035 [Ruminococcus sp.]|nr:hypothetical protein [Ruminococcus sp.]
MKLYKSLIYREMKLSRAYYGFCILFFALLIATVLVGLILPNVDEGVAPGEARLGFTLVSLVIPVLGALFVTRDGGELQKGREFRLGKGSRSLPGHKQAESFG